MEQKQFNIQDFSKNPNQPVVTRNGKSVRIICVDGPDRNFPVVGFITGWTSPNCWTKTGEASPRHKSSDDLFLNVETLVVRKVDECFDKPKRRIVCKKVTTLTTINGSPKYNKYIQYIVQEYDESVGEWATCRYINKNFESVPAIFGYKQAAMSFINGKFGQVEEEIIDL